jgi:peptidoglycan/xylan/chitin deacetylase (PgdA/CDA1 family)
MRRGVLLPLLILSLAGCVTSKTTDREPAAQTVPSTSNLDSGPDITALVQAMTENFESNRVPLESLIRSSVALAGDAQKLSASFDVRLNRFLANPPKGTYQVQSELDCKIWESYPLAQQSEETLLAIQRELLQANRQDNYTWFVSLLYANHGDTVTDVLTKAQMMRSLADQHGELCANNSNCLSFPKVIDPRKRPFDAFNDQEMLAFKKRNLEKIAIYSSADFDTNEKGSCFSEGDRKPQQVTTPSFDWKGHHTSGYGLKPGTFSITYDDGPNPKYTAMIAQMWDDSKLVKPTFFWLAMNIARNIDLAKSVRDRGYLIGSHTYDHADLGNLAKATGPTEINRSNRGLFQKGLATMTDWKEWQAKMMEAEIVTATRTIYSLLELDQRQPGGEHLIRLPYGSGVKNEMIGSYFAKLNARHYFWTIDSLDWQDHNPASVLERVEKQMQVSKRGIILFHDIHPQSVEASRQLMEKFMTKTTVVPATLVPLPRKW